MTDKELAELFEQLEIELISSMNRTLEKHKQWEKSLGFDWTSWQSLKIKSFERFRRECESIMSDYSDIIKTETRKMLEEQFSEGEELEAEQLAEQGFTETSNENFFEIFDEKIESLIEEIHGKETTAEKSALRMMNDVYRQTMIQAEIAVSTGAKTVQQAIEDAVRAFAKQGINCIEYRDGRRINIADYVYMALRTANTRAGLLGAAKQRMALGIDTVRVTSYNACSETCYPWQGKVYIDDVFASFSGEISGNMGKSNNGKWYLLLSVAIEAGLFHPNCRHSLTSYNEKNSNSPQVDEKKARANYKLEQQQRALERKVRYWKRRAEAENNPEFKELYKKQVRNAQKNLREFIDEHSDVLRRDPWREKTYSMPEGTRKRNPNENQFIRYRERLGASAPQTLDEFEKIKYDSNEGWIKLQTEYRYKGVIDRLLDKNSNLKVFSKASEIPDEYNKAARSLSYNQRDGIYHYTHYEEGIRMNKYLGGDPETVLSADELSNLQNTQDALKHSSLPYDTVLCRGANSKYLNGFSNLPKKISEWKGEPLSYDGFASTSLIRETSYFGNSDKDVLLFLVKRAQQPGALYVEEISYNHLNNKPSEYEILLQNGAKYSIIEAQKFRGKTIIVAEVL